MDRYGFNAHGIGPLSSDGETLEKVTVKRPMRIEGLEWFRFAEEITVLLNRTGKDTGMRPKPFIKYGKRNNNWLVWRSREEYLKGRIPTVSRRTPAAALYAHFHFINGRYSWTEI